MVCAKQTYHLLLIHIGHILVFQTNRQNKISNCPKPVFPFAFSGNKAEKKPCVTKRITSDTIEENHVQDFAYLCSH